jgi:hypothetical protein
VRVASHVGIVRVVYVTAPFSSLSVAGVCTPRSRQVQVIYYSLH